MPNKKKSLGSIRAKVGLPAKAGRRRPHNIMKDKNGDYVAAPFKARPKVEKVEKPMFIMDYTVKPVRVV